MHGKDTFSEFREFINTMESRVQELGKVHGVELVTSDKDKRYKYVHLTDLGKKKARDVKHFREAIHEQLLEGISKEDAETAFRVFHQIRMNLEKNKE